MVFNRNSRHFFSLQTVFMNPKLINMKTNSFFLVLAFLGLFLSSCQSNNKQAENTATKEEPLETEWVSFFNGENLDGWVVRGKANWVVEDGVLIGKA